MTASTNRTMPLLIALLATIGPFGIDMYLPSIPAMAQALGSGEGAVQLSLMTFFVGLMLGQLVFMVHCPINLVVNRLSIWV